VPNFVSFVPSIAELAHAEKSHTQSLNRSSSLFDVRRTEALVLRKNTTKLVTEMLHFYTDDIPSSNVIHVRFYTPANP